MSKRREQEPLVRISAPGRAPRVIGLRRAILWLIIRDDTFSMRTALNRLRLNGSIRSRVGWLEMVRPERGPA